MFNPRHSFVLFQRVIPVLFLAGLLACGCESPTSRAERRRQTQDLATYRLHLPRIHLLNEPVQLKGDTAWPANAVRQTFIWNGYGTEWRVALLDPAAEYAEFIIKRPHNVADQWEGLVLYFELWPEETASSLAVALFDNSTTNAYHMAVQPIAPYVIARQNEAGWLSVAIPLARFALPTYAVMGPKIYETEAPSLDWSRIAGVRLIRLNPDLEERGQLILRDLQFAPEMWVTGGRP